MNDKPVNPGFNYVREAQVTLKPAQSAVIDFNPDKGGPVFPVSARTNAIEIPHPQPRPGGG